MTKPFDFRELVARIKALLRRNSEKEHPILKCGPLELDPEARECRVKGKILSLRRREFDIIELLLRNENQVFTREKLISSYGGRNMTDRATWWTFTSSTFGTNSPYGCDTLVVTVRGVGYKISCPEYAG